MADIKINPKTGQIAVPQADGSFKIYSQGQYKFNQQTNEYAVPRNDGSWEIHATRSGPTMAAAATRTPEPLYEDDRETRATNPGIIPGNGLLPIGKTKGTGEIVFPYFGGGVAGATLGAVGEGAQTMKDVVEGRLDPTSQEAVNGTIGGVTLMTPLSAASRTAEAVIPGTLRSARLGPVKTPTAEELRLAGKAGMKEARSLGVDYSSDAVKVLGDDIAQKLTDDGFSDVLTSKTFSILAKLKEPPEGSVASLDNIVTLRKALQKAAGDFNNPSEQAAASRAIDSLDDFVVAASPASVVAGPAAAAGKIVDDARGNFAASFRSGRVTDKLEQAVDDSAAANSGLNLDNRTRQLINSILKSDQESRGFTKEELTALREVVHGKTTTNAARWLGNFLGGGGGLGSLVSSGIGAGLGSVIGGLPGAMVGAGTPAAMGVTLRKLAAALTRQQAREAETLIRQRSPLYKKAAQTPPVVQGLNPDIRSIINRAVTPQLPPLLQQLLGQQGAQ